MHTAAASDEHSSLSTLDTLLTLPSGQAGTQSKIRPSSRIVSLPEARCGIALLRLEPYSLSLSSLPHLVSCLLHTPLSGAHVQRHNATGALIAAAAALRMEDDRFIWSSVAKCWRLD